MQLVDSDWRTAAKGHTMITFTQLLLAVLGGIAIGGLVLSCMETQR